jgi:hypothetical protein
MHPQVLTGMDDKVYVLQVVGHGCPPSERARAGRADRAAERGQAGRTLTRRTTLAPGATVITL